MKKNLYIPIYNKKFLLPNNNNIVEKYFKDLYQLNKNQIITEKLSYNKSQFIKNYLFIKKKKDIYKKEILKILKKNDINFYKKLDSSVDFWLIHFLSIIKSRYDKLLTLKKKYKKLHITSCSFQEFSFDRTEDFLKCFKNNSIENIYIFQKIAKFLNLNLIDYNKKIRIKKFRSSKYSRNLKYHFLKSILKIKKINLFIELYYNSKDFTSKLIFFFREGGLNFNLRTLRLQFKNYNSKINLKIKERDIFDKIVNLFIKDFFPKILYSNDSLFKLKYINKNIKNLSSSIALASSDEFRILASFVGKNKVNTYQHGSDYGLLKYNLLYDFEKSYSNFLGWKNKKSFNLFFNKIKNSKENKLEIYKKKIKKRKKITFFSSVYYHNILRYEAHLINFESNFEKIKNVSDLYNNLDEPIKKNFIIRNQQHDYGWNYKEIFLKNSKRNKNVKFSNSKTSFDAMNNTKIFITDHISTSFYEAIQLNIPILVICDIEKYLFINKVKKGFLLLKKKNIIFNDYKSCSKYLNEYYKVIHKIWFSKETQNSLKKFKAICF